MRDDPVNRRTALRFGGILLASGIAGCQNDQDGGDGDPGGPTETESDGATDGLTETGTDPAGGETSDPEATPTAGGEDSTIAARRVAAGFTSPVGVEIPQPGRRFVVDQPGQIFLHDDDGLHEEPFLDLTDETVDVGGFSEQGLLGLAFHPEFEENGRFFARYSAPPREGTPDDYSHTFVLSEFAADPEARTADPDSERTILEIPEPQGNHNAGAITFGPDGYLYVAVGDGGAANDQGLGHVEDWYDDVGGGNGQDVTENLLGSVLRIDVDSEPSETARNGAGGTGDDEDGDRNYAIPDDNPLVGEAGLDEHYAWGFRNPWRMTFGPDGRLFVGDVGQNDWEEVNVVEKGGNYGWNVREATHCFQAEDCPSETPDGDPLIDPVIEYPQGGQAVSGVSVICGYLYDGDDMPAFEGQFVFGDWRASGNLFAAREREDGLWPTREVSVEADGQFGPNVLSFGRNPAGELFVCTTAETGVQGDTGALFRLTGAE